MFVIRERLYAHPVYLDCDNSDRGGGTGFETRCEPVRRVDREKEIGDADSLHLILSPMSRSSYCHLCFVR